MTTGEYWLDSVNGDDAAAGTSEAAAWRTASKLSTFAAANPWAVRGLRLRYGSTFTTSLKLPSQGHISQFLRVRPYGNPAAGNPIIAITSGPVGVGALDFDSSLAVWVEDLTIDGGAVAYAPGIAVKSFAYPERSAPLRIERVNIANCGYDAVTASFSGSALNPVFGYAAGSNNQLAGVYIADVVIDKVRNDGISLIGANFGALVERITGTNIGTGTATPIDATSGDFLTCHDFAGQIIFRDSEVDGCVNGVHAINFGAPSLIDGVRIKNPTENCITLEMWSETHGAVEERLYWVVRNCILNQPASATGLAAVILGRAAVAGSLISADLHNNLINNQDATPAILAYFAADARADECFLNVQNNAFIRGHASGKHVEVQRNGRTPRININANRYDVDAAAAFKRDATTYSFAGWQALGYDADSAVGALGLTGDTASDFDNARPLVTSALRAAGVNLAPENVPFYGYAREDHDGHARPVLGPWDIGPLQFRDWGPVPREAALLALADALETINVDAGDWRSAVRLAQVMRHAPDANLSGYKPYAYFDQISEPMSRGGTDGTDDQYDRTLTLEIVVVAEHADADAEASNVIHDVELALADLTLGGAVWNLEITRNRHSVQERQFMVGVSVSLMYRTSRLDPALKV